MDFRSVNDYKWFGVDWATHWIEVDRARKEIRVWKDNFKRELVQTIGLSSSKAGMYWGSRDTTVTEREAGKQFYVMHQGRIYHSVYQFRTYSNVMRDAYGQYIKDMMEHAVQTETASTEIKLILGLHGNQDSTRYLRFSSPNPLASEVLLKLKKIMEVDRDALEKFGYDRELSGIKLLCRGKTLKPIDQLKHGDVVYAQPSPKLSPVESISKTPRLSTFRLPESPLQSESDLKHLVLEDKQWSRTSGRPSPLACEKSPLTPRISLFNVRSWKASFSKEPNVKKNQVLLDVGRWV